MSDEPGDPGTLVVLEKIPKRLIGTVISARLKSDCKGIREIHVCQMDGRLFRIGFWFRNSPAGIRCSEPIREGTGNPGMRGNAPSCTRPGSGHSGR